MRKYLLLALITILLLISSVSAIVNSDTRLYLTGNGTSGSGTFVDESTYHHAMTRTGSYLNVSTTQKAFGTGSISSSISGGDYLHADPATEFEMSSSNVDTIHVWAKVNTFSAWGPYLLYYGGPNSDWGANDGGQYAFYFSAINATHGYPKFAWGEATAADSMTSPTYVAAGTWYQYDLVRVNSTGLNLYVNGNRVVTTNSFNPETGRTGATCLAVAGSCMGGEVGSDSYVDDLVLTDADFSGTVVQDVEFISNPTAAQTVTQNSNGRVSSEILTATGTGNTAASTYTWYAQETSNSTVFNLGTDSSLVTNPLSPGTWNFLNVQTNTFGSDASSISQLTLTDSLLPAVLYLPGNTSVDDISPAGYTVTANDGAASSTAVKKFGAGSISFDGTSNLTLPMARDFAFGGKDFTIAFWYRPVNLPGNSATNNWDMIYTAGTDTNNKTYLGINNNSGTYRWHWRVYSSGSLIVDLANNSVTAEANNWYWVVASRSGNTFSLYSNGALVGTSTSSATYPDISTVNSVMGEYFQNYGYHQAAGYLDDFTIINGYSLDGSSVPTAELLSYINLNAAFSCTPLTGTEPLSVTCTDASAGSPNAWSWDFGDGSTENATAQNPVHHFRNQGTFDVSLTASNAGGFYDTETKSDYVTVSYDYAHRYAEYDLTVGAKYPVSVYVRDSSTDALIPTASVFDENGDYLTSAGTGAFSGDLYAGAHTLTASAAYYSNTSSTVVVTGFNDTFTISMVATGSSGDTYNVKYPPSDIRFHVQEIAGASIPSVYVTAVPFQTSLGNYGYVASLFGYDLTAVPLESMTLAGVTDSKGDIVFAMMTDVSYSMNFTKSGYTFDDLIITPHDDNYVIYPSGTGNPFLVGGEQPAAQVTYYVNTTRYNKTMALLNVTYDDVAGVTANGTIRINKTGVAP